MAKQYRSWWLSSPCRVNNEAIMIGKTLHHPASGITGSVDAISDQPDGKRLVRIDDHWVSVDDCQTVLPKAWVFIAVAAFVGLGLYGLVLVS